MLPAIPITCSFQLVAFPTNEDKIVLFGGHHSASFIFYILSKEGEIKKDLSKVNDIPGNMCQGAVTEIEGKIFAVGARIEWDGE